MGLTKQHVLATFGPLASGEASRFFANVADDVEWTVTGSAHPLARSWRSKDEFWRESWLKIGGMLQKPMRLSIEGVLVEADTGKQAGLKGRAVVELRGEGGVLKNGKAYNNEYCWVVGFNEGGEIQSVRASLDTAQLRDALAGE